MNADFQAYARQLSGQTIDERIVELTQAIKRNAAKANTYSAQIALLRQELARRVIAYKNVEVRLHHSLGRHTDPRS
mgnify:CR=1 FL=1